MPTTVTKSTCESQRVFELLREYSTSKWILVEPGGNHGDHLICLGMEKLAKLSQIAYESMTFDEFMKAEVPSDAVIYIHGSGGYVPWWSGTPMKILEKATRTHPGVVIQGPSTFHTDSEFIRERVAKSCEAATCRRLVIFAREQTSFDAIEKPIGEFAEVACDHDTALNLSADDLSEWTASVTRRHRYALRVTSRQGIGDPHRYGEHPAIRG